MRLRQLYILMAMVIAGLAVQAVLASPAKAAYLSQATTTSINLLSGSSASSITNFYYNIASLPGNSSVKVQFSQNNSTWYSSANVLNGYDTLTTIGGADLSLSALSWSGSAFYYRLELNSTSDLTGTPAIEDIRLDYAPNSGYGNQFVFNNNGQVGIGTSSPDSKLTVFSAADDAAIEFSSASGLNYKWTMGLDFSDAGKFVIASSSALGTSNRLVIDGSGRLGIGTSSPYAKLSVVDSSPNASADVFVISTSTSGAIFRVDGYGKVWSDTAAATPADYAEYFRTTDTDLGSGEAVCINVVQNNTVRRCARPADSDVMGIVSTHPGFLGNYKSEYANSSNYKIIAMLGQIPAFVSAENGPVRPGDLLTPASSTPGYIMRANAGDSTVGVALERLEQDKGLINVLISRRNKTLTVEEVEQKVTEHIAAMEIEDEVNIMIAQAVKNLNLSDEINQVLDPKLLTISQQWINTQGDLSQEIKNLSIDVSWLKDKFASTSVASYMGFIAEEAPLEILSVDGKGIDLYKMSGFMWAGMKAQEKKFADLELRIKNLEELTGNAASIAGAIEVYPENNLGQSLTASTFAWILAQFENIGVKISNGIVQATEFIADKVVAKKVVTEFFEMKDSVTGDIWCMSIANGEIVKFKGACGEVEPPSAPYVEPVSGCIDNTAINFNPSAAKDDGSCAHQSPEPEVKPEPALEAPVVDEPVPEPAVTP